MQARGLKPRTNEDLNSHLESRLMQARGLKQCGLKHATRAILSRLMQARGLKRYLAVDNISDDSRASCRRVD